MSLMLKLKRRIIDLPIFQTLRSLPVSSSAGACACTDERGTHRYIYMLLGATSFWRYDTWTDSWQQLPSPPSITFTAGCALIFDPSRGAAGYVWLFTPLSSNPYAAFAYYDVAAATWTSRAVPSGLSAQWATDAHMAHTCSAYNPAGDDDYIYLVGNGSATWYRYSINGNSWSTMSPGLPAAAWGGCALIWPWSLNANRLYLLVGGANSSLYYYTISAGVWSGSISYLPKQETFAAGTSSAYDAGNRIYFVKDGTHRLYYYQLNEDVMHPAGVFPYTSGTTIAGDGLVYVKTPDGAEFLYYRIQSGKQFWRMLVGWF